MKNIDVQKIRQLLKRILMPQCSASEGLNLVEQALALLPCPTCNDLYKWIQGGKPCPDCQPKICPTCNGTGKVPHPLPHTCIGQTWPCGICKLSDPCPDCQ